MERYVLAFDDDGFVCDCVCVVDTFFEKEKKKKKKKVSRPVLIIEVPFIL